jgi:hypothetical protein
MRLARACALTAGSLAVLSVGAGAASGAPASPGPSASTFRVAYADSTLTPSRARKVAAARATASWGGATTATDGEVVNISFSDAYPVDATLARSWADYMTSLVHGSELATVTILLAPLTEVEQYCGAQAYACYSPSQRTIVAPGEDPGPGTTAKGVLAHEYGHHVAASRLNPPFASVDYGTKRWASYTNVCARTQSGDLFPGAEDARNYALNPGEGFAEAYRVLNEQRLGLSQEAWEIVSPVLEPDAGSLAALSLDVTQPWTGASKSTLKGALTTKTRTRTFRIATPLDGTLTIVPTQSTNTRVSVTVSSVSGAAAARTFATRTGRSLSTLVCGARAYTVRVKLTGKVTRTTHTTVQLAVAKP